MSLKKPIKVALAGLGTIGSGVYQLIKEHQSQNAPIEIVKILETNPNGVYAKPIYDVSPQLFTNKLTEVAKNDDIDLIVETIGGKGFAKTLIEQALQNKKHVVSANKDLIAVEGFNLNKLAESNGVQFLFEASVGGAIPVLSLLKNYFTTSDIVQLKGIVNGTTNYILSEMDKNNLDFDVALSDAQNKGFAEADPTNDIKGYDARYKLAILIYLITGLWLNYESITVEGIDQLTKSDFEYADRLKRKIKLIAFLAVENNDLKAFVLPLMLPTDAPLALINGSTNAVTIQGKFAEDISLIGKGAGSLPTASAILSDIYAIANNLGNNKQNTAQFGKNGDLKLQNFDEYKFKHTLRFEVYDKPGTVGKIGTALGKHDVSIYALEQLPQYNDVDEHSATIFTITLNEAVEANVQNALKEINEFDFIVRPVSILREI